MERPITLLVLALGSLIFPAGALAHEDHPPLRSVSVSGEGEVAARPDRARLLMYVDRLTPDVKAGESEVNKVVRAYLAEARSLGAKEEQLSTTGVSIQPEYVWDEKLRQQKLAGYRVRREIAVVVNDLEQLGEFILRATKVGVNQINPPMLESSKAKEIQRQALVKAADAAKSKAQLLAETLNAKLGPVRCISANDTNVPPPMQMKEMAMRAQSADANAEMGISLGEIRYRADVSAVFDLLAP